MLNITAIELAAQIKQKKISVTEAVTQYLNAAKAQNGAFNCFTQISEEHALKRARQVQERIDKGESVSALAGVPIAIKDNISVKDTETSCGSKMLSGYKPVFDAFVTEKITEADMIIIGMLNMDEFAMGSSSETGYKGAVKNPWAPERVAGGSSGGSAAAVAASLTPLALGSDTGGSIRQPCSFCGVTGIKPTYGSVSRYGLVAFASSLDQIGPIAANIDDCAALLSVISAPDKKDSTCVIKEPFKFDNKILPNMKDLKIGIPANYFNKGLEDSVKTAVLAAADVFKEAGAQTEEFEMPLLDVFIPAYYAIACAEASSNLSRYDGLKFGYRNENAKTLSDVYRLSRNEGFGIEVKRRIMLGSFVLSSGYYDAYYKKALQARAIIKNTYTDLFKRFDIILTPTAPTTAYKAGENINDPIKMYMGDIYTVSVNLAGLPAVSLPCGFDDKGLPIGVQLIADMFAERKLINISKFYQNTTDYHQKRPPLN